MCGRYTTNTEEELIEIKEIIEDISIRISKDELQFLNKEVAPTCMAPVITNKKELKILKWGFTKWDNKGVIFNAKSETVKESRFFMANLYNGRCVIPARYYFEWEHQNNKKIKYQIKTNDSMIFMAGIMKQESPTLETYTILTKKSDDEIAFIHDRMPVLLHKEEVESWLDGTYMPEDISNNSFVIEYQKAIKEE